MRSRVDVVSRRAQVGVSRRELESSQRAGRRVDPIVFASSERVDVTQNAHEIIARVRRKTVDSTRRVARADARERARDDVARVREIEHDGVDRHAAAQHLTHRAPVFLSRFTSSDGDVDRGSHRFERGGDRGGGV